MRIKNLLFGILCGIALPIFAQNELELLNVYHSSNSMAPLMGSPYEPLDEVYSATSSWGFVLNYGHLLGKSRAEMFYELDYNMLVQHIDVTKVQSGALFNEIPMGYYHLPRFSQLSLSGGISTPLQKGWNFSSMITLSMADDFKGSELSPFLTWSNLSYIEKTKNDHVSFGFGVFLNQLKNRRFVFPIFSLQLQTPSRGLEILLPERLSLWQKVGRNNYIEAHIHSHAYSITFSLPNEVNATDIYVVRAGVGYHHYVTQHMKFSGSLTAPLHFYTITARTESLDLIQQNGLGFQVGIHFLLVDE